MYGMVNLHRKTSPKTMNSHTHNAQVVVALARSCAAAFSEALSSCAEGICIGPGSAWGGASSSFRLTRLASGSGRSAFPAKLLRGSPQKKSLGFLALPCLGCLALDAFVW